MVIRETVTALDIVAGRPWLIKFLETFLTHGLGIHVEPILAFLDMGARRACLFKYSL